MVPRRLLFFSFFFLGRGRDYTCLGPLDGLAGAAESTDGLDGKCRGHVQVSVLESRRKGGCAPRDSMGHASPARMEHQTTEGFLRSAAGGCRDGFAVAVAVAVAVHVPDVVCAFNDASTMASPSNVQTLSRPTTQVQYLSGTKGSATVMDSTVRRCFQNQSQVPKSRSWTLSRHCKSLRPGTALWRKEQPPLRSCYRS